MRSNPSLADPPAVEPPHRAPGTPGLLAGLGVVGLETIEPAVLAALIGGEPLLLIGAHGTGKTYLLARIAEALALSFRHYNASLLNYDDLVGYPLPDARGELRFVRTPASIWGAEAVLVDEIARSRPDMQNRIFPIIHERRVQGILLEELRLPLGGDEPAGGRGRGLSLQWLRAPRRGARRPVRVRKSRCRAGRR